MCLYVCKEQKKLNKMNMEWVMGERAKFLTDDEQNLPLCLVKFARMTEWANEQVDW